MTMRYAVIDQENNVVNVIVWDGVADYNPGEGLRTEQILDGEEQDAVIGGKWYGATRFVNPENGPTS